MVYSRWLADMDMEVIPTEPKIVTSSLGPPVEARQIAVIPLESERSGGEPVVIAAWVVEESAWSRVSAPAIGAPREVHIEAADLNGAHRQETSRHGCRGRPG
jgi:hypothetical protein